MNNNIIGLASDHAGYETKLLVIEYLKEHGYEYKDFGCYSSESCDYADPAHELGKAVGGCQGIIVLDSASMLRQAQCP